MRVEDGAGWGGVGGSEDETEKGRSRMGRGGGRMRVGRSSRVGQIWVRGGGNQTIRRNDPGQAQGIKGPVVRCS